MASKERMATVIKLTQMTFIVQLQTWELLLHIDFTVGPYRLHRSVKLISKSDSKVSWRGQMDWFPNPLVVMDLHQSSLDLTQSPVTWCNFDTKQTAFDKRSQLC